MDNINEPLDPESITSTLDESALKKTYRLSDPSPEQLENLRRIRKMPFYLRIFRKFEKGSLRSVVILWVRMTMGIGVMTLPFYMVAYGLLGGIIALIIGSIVTLLSFLFIFEASVKTGKKNFRDLINELLPGPIAKIFTITYVYDLTVPTVCYSAVTWSLFCYVLNFFGLLKESWIEDKNRMLLHEYDPEVFLLRTIYFIVIFVISIPLFLKKEIGSLKNIAYAFLVVMVAYLIYIMIEAPFFREHYQKQGTLEVEYLFKTPSWDWVVSFFSMVLAYYVQPFILLLRGELLSPTHKRLNKVSRYGIIFEAILFIAFTSICYISFGDNFTPPLMILRIAYPGKSEITEYIFKAGLVLFFLLTLFGLCIYNVGVREYLMGFFKFRNERTGYVFFSLFPFFICCIIALLMPRVTDQLSYAGLLFCNFNGFVIPALLKLQITKLERQSRVIQFLLYLLIAFYVIAGIGGFVVKILD